MLQHSVNVHLSPLNTRPPPFLRIRGRDFYISEWTCRCSSSKSTSIGYHYHSCSTCNITNHNCNHFLPTPCFFAGCLNLFPSVRVFSYSLYFYLLSFILSWNQHLRSLDGAVSSFFCSCTSRFIIYDQKKLLSLSIPKPAQRINLPGPVQSFLESQST